MTATFDAIVIGAGVNGLVAAAALGRAGRRVLLLERGASLGGEARASEFAPGYRAVPLALDPGWLPPMVVQGLGLEGLAVDYADTAVSVSLGGGQFLGLARDPAIAADTIRRYSASDAAKWAAFTSRLRKLTGFIEALYQLPPPDLDTTSLADLVPLLGLARKFRGLGREDMIELFRTMPMSVQELLDDWFESEPLKAAVAAGGVKDIRQGPRSGGTSFVLLHHLVGLPLGAVRGASYWRGGPEAVATAVEDVARRANVTVRTAAAVERITMRDDRVTGVALASGEEITAPVVISTADPVHTLLRLVDPVWLDAEFLRAVGNIKLRGARATVLYALDRLPAVPGADGVVTLTPTLEAMERSYDAAKYGRVSEHPHVEFTVPSLRWPSLAPDGKHVLVAHAQYAPYRLRDGAVWDAARREALGEQVTRAIDTAVPGFAGSVLHRVTLTPKDLEDRYGLTEGAVTHGELTLDQILFMRPVPGAGRYAMPVEGLYLGGPGAHPGPGILGGAGWLAAKRVIADRKKK